MVTVTVAELEWLAVGPAPVTVNATVPNVASPVAVKVSVELSPELIEAGSKIAVTPSGRSETSRLSG